MSDIPNTEEVRVALIAAALKMTDKMAIDDKSTAATIRQGIIQNFDEALRGAWKAHVAAIKGIETEIK